MEALEIYRRPVVLFDFDGTVADTGRAVMSSTRKTLAARGFSEAQMGDLRRMIGPPLWKSFHDFYGFSREESLVVADEYRAFFDELGPEEYPCSMESPSCSMALSRRGIAWSWRRHAWRQSALTWWASWGFRSLRRWLA